MLGTVCVSNATISSKLFCNSDIWGYQRGQRFNILPLWLAIFTDAFVSGLAALFWSLYECVWVHVYNPVIFYDSIVLLPYVCKYCLFLFGVEGRSKLEQDISVKWCIVLPLSLGNSCTNLYSNPCLKYSYRKATEFRVTKNRRARKQQFVELYISQKI